MYFVACCLSPRLSFCRYSLWAAVTGRLIACTALILRYAAFAMAHGLSLSQHEVIG